MSLRQLITQHDLPALREALAQNPALANEALPYDEHNPARAHPLHRLCDDVFSKFLTDEEAVEVASLLLDHGAWVDGYGLVENRDTPLLAAASLHAEKVGMLYVDRGATITHRGANGGTALHWAAWTGRDKLVQHLIDAGAAIDERCTEFLSTPLLWAVHGYVFGGTDNRHHQVECVRLLLRAGADKQTPNREGKTPIDLLNEQDTDMRSLLR